MIGFAKLPGSRLDPQLVEVLHKGAPCGLAEYCMKVTSAHAGHLGYLLYGELLGKVSLHEE